MSQKTPDVVKPRGATTEPDNFFNLVFTQTNSIPLTPMMAGEIQKTPPIVRRHRVLTLTNVVAQSTIHELAKRRHLIHCQTFNPEESVNRVSRSQHFELS